MNKFKYKTGDLVRMGNKEKFTYSDPDHAGLIGTVQFLDRENGLNWYRIEFKDEEYENGAFRSWFIESEIDSNGFDIGL